MNDKLRLNWWFSRMKKIIVLITFGLFLCPSLAFANTWVINIDDISPFLRMLETIKKPKTIVKTKAVTLNKPKAAEGKTKTPRPVAVITVTPAKPATPLTYKKPKPVKPQQSVIIGKTNGLPVLTVNFVNKPLWQVLQSISDKTGYVFSTKRINLGKKITLKGRYNFADILARIFNGKDDNTSVNVEKKLIKVKGRP